MLHTIGWFKSEVETLNVVGFIYNSMHHKMLLGFLSAASSRDAKNRIFLFRRCQNEFKREMTQIEAEQCFANFSFCQFLLGHAMNPYRVLNLKMLKHRRNVMIASYFAIVQPLLGISIFELDIGMLRPSEFLRDFNFQVGCVWKLKEK